MKKVVVSIVVILMALSLSACMTPRKLGWKPCCQPNTRWVSDDGKIVFQVNNDYEATGTLDVDGEIVHIYVTEGPSRSTEMEIFPVTVLEDEVILEEERLELWLCIYKSENEFVARVKDTSFYEPEAEFTFYKVG